MKTTIDLDPDVYRAASVRAKDLGERVETLISQLVRQALDVREADEPTAAPAKFPTVPVPPGAPAIPAATIDRFLNEEGLV